MSKSDPSPASRIALTDDADTVAAKIRKAKTDAEPLPETLDALADRPEASNLLTIYAALAGRDRADVLAEFAGQGFGRFKPALADLAVATLGPIRERLLALLENKPAVGQVLADGAARAAALGAPVLADAKRAVGLQG